MSSNHHKLYLDEVIALAKTISIKSEYSATQVNSWLQQVHGKEIVDYDHPETWKYYLNLCGNYHDKDERMQVISLDTLAVIEFSKSTLVDHPATKKSYSHGSRYYKELIAKYPKQETLILGILYPATMSKLLDAPDYSIVSYDHSLVQSNEENLIKQLDEWTTTYFRRWWVSGFNINHTLYAASFFGVYYQQLPLKIIELREYACGTSQAHNFHVKMHLAGYNGLDEFLPYLNQKQTMWLYRNIAYINKHAGLQSTFKWLVENILTNRGLPLSSFDLIHSSDALLNGGSTCKSYFSAIAENEVLSAHVGLIKPIVILNKIKQAATGNESYDLKVPDAISSTKYSLQNSYQTKVLESSFVDVTDNSALTTVELAISLWSYSACKNNFNVYTRISHPLTGAEITLTTLDAYYLFLFAYASAHGNGMSVLPPIHSISAPVWPKPTISSIWNICIQNGIKREVIELLYNLMPETMSFINLDQFKTGFANLEDTLAKQSIIVSSADTFEKEASYKTVLNALWSDQSFVRLETNRSSLAYFAEKSIDIGFLQPEIWQVIYLNLFTAVTGLDMQTTAAMSGMQKAMVSIMRRLSSYSVLYVDPISSAAIRALGHTSLLVQESETTSRNYFEIPVNSNDIENKEINGSFLFDLSITSSDIKFWFTAEELPIEVNTTSDILFANEINDGVINLPVNFVGVEPVNMQGKPDISYIQGLSDILNNPETFVDVPNIYNSDDWPNPIIPTVIQTSDWVTNLHLPFVQASVIGPQMLNDFKPFSAPQKLRYFQIDNNIIDIKGIWSTYGESEINVFKSESGNLVTTRTFTFVPYFDDALVDWRSTIGNITGISFDAFSSLPSGVDINGFKPVEVQVELIMKRAGPLGETNFGLTPVSNANFSFYQMTDGFNVTINKVDTTTLTLADWLQSGKQVTLAFAQQFPRLDIGQFTSNVLPLELTSFTVKSVIYHMLAPVQTVGILNLDTLYHIGVIQIAGLTDWGSTNLRVDYENVIFTSSTTKLDIADFQTAFDNV